MVKNNYLAGIAKKAQQRKLNSVGRELTRIWIHHWTVASG
ncbi:hypothetical protein L910_0677 [Vibrio fluvialis PG41]|uniref:Uncharacterized protein n=1 Tax=Vibrio fluvialis PG41 TaxID=1336752 RepID=S7IBK6_VIBFL|nr:hypothetical protein L910_0677 [Vibrio fluvialis PG41]